MTDVLFKTEWHICTHVYRVIVYTCEASSVSDVVEYKTLNTKHTLTPVTSDLTFKLVMVNLYRTKC